MEGNDRQAKTASDRSKITARKRKRYEEFQQPTILSLPTELVMEIVARVGASSLRDLFEVKLSCKSLYAIAEDSYVFEKVSVEELPKLQMSRRSKEQSSSFYRRCIECGNSEALYREGVKEYFSRENFELGLNYLEKGRRRGHLGASYILSGILLCGDDEACYELGSKLMIRIKQENKIGECRRKLKTVMNSIWRNYKLEARIHNNCAEVDRHLKDGWPKPMDQDDLQCEICLCNREINFICNSLDGRGTDDFML